MAVKHRAKRAAEGNAATPATPATRADIPDTDAATTDTAGYVARLGPRARTRGQAEALAAAFGVFAGDVELVDHRQFRPAVAVARRSLARGFLVNTAELAALAHVPYEAGTVPGLRRSAARPVAPPPALRRLPTNPDDERRAS
ncbi:MAG: hypothetical protein GEV03_07040 [Streptosporangiales bacterium]|nr:hypothetical protein [Streptosporangiales bacterium]